MYIGYIIHINKSINELFFIANKGNVAILKWRAKLVKYIRNVINLEQHDVFGRIFCGFLLLLASCERSVYVKIDNQDWEQFSGDVRYQKKEPDLKYWLVMLQLYLIIVG